MSEAMTKSENVALRKESVDRNPYIPLAKVRHCEVALRKESVDRNGHGVFVTVLRLRSLSARRAWIEITSRREFPKWGCRRSPQGERG